MKTFFVLLFFLFYFVKIKQTKCRNMQVLDSLNVRDKFFLRSFRRTSMLKDEKNELAVENPNQVFRILYFYTTWCPACKVQKGEMQKLMSAYKNKISLKKFDCDKEVDMVKKYGITSLPTILIYKKNKLIHKSEKLVRIDELMNIIKNNL